MTRPRKALLAAVILCAPGLAAESKPWWLAKPVRLIQTNLREIDAADFNVAKYAADMREYGANAVLINVGGIVANYPTRLEYHYRNPGLKFDLTGEVVKRLHQDGVRVFARFDFSKINETMAARRPEWLYKSVKGATVNYNGQVHTCINGGYQQEYQFQILGEVLDGYPVDGVFFNMIGYQVRDYSQIYHGICQCDSCRRRFNEFSGGDTLPVKEDPDDPIFRKYQEFKRRTSDELFHRVNAFIKGKRKEIAICTYTDAGVDLIRTESGSHIQRVGPAWNYHGSDNVKRALGSFGGKQSSNAAVHFVDMPFRHAAVSPHLTGMRLIENMLNGGGLDFYLMGRLDNQDDRAGLATVREVFRFHQQNERWFTGIHSGAEICLVRGAAPEFEGLMRILSENHVVFDAMEARQLEQRDTPRPLESYKLVILADTAALSEAACKRLDDYVAGGGAVLATGATSTRDELGNPLGRFRLRAAGVEPRFEVQPKALGIYLKVRPQDKAALRNPSFDELDIVFVYGELLRLKPLPEARGHLGLITDAMYGPPEKSYYRTVTEVPGLIFNQFGKGRMVSFPFQIGQHYNHAGQYGHSMLVMAAMRDLLESRPNLAVTTSPLVEVTRQESDDGSFGWIGLANHSGQLGAGFHAPLPIREVVIRVRPDKPVKEVRLLRRGITLPAAEEAQGWLRVTVPQLDAFEVVLLTYR